MKSKPLLLSCLSLLAHASLICGFQHPTRSLLLLRMPNNHTFRQQEKHVTSTAANNHYATPLRSTKKTEEHKEIKPFLTQQPLEKSQMDTTQHSPKGIHPFVSLVGGTTSALVSVLFYAALVWKRDSLMVAFFLGSIANAILSKVLKKLIQQTRPPELGLLFAEKDDSEQKQKTSFLRVQPSDGGMPSSHAMSLGFIGTFTVLHLFLLVSNAAQGGQPWLPAACTAVAIGLFTITSLVFRVQAKLHTRDQVLVGWMVGSANACLFYRFAEAPLRKLLQETLLKNTSDGLLPYPWLVVPAVVGALIVGSVERRITNWINRRKAEKAE